ncbi:MAG: hypothetical protein EU535_04450 [Promethearchaeota archaeon]|nr:MAG: hypothetical protein EU535_04450 [Candidatus Lokiarchaeota archaeon]
MDILTLDIIPSISFSNNLYQNEQLKFQRHHIFPNNKDSLDPNKLVLTINKLHNNLEGCTNLIIKLLKERIKGVYIIPDYYKNLENGYCLWQEFLNRRNDLRTKGIKYFFKTYYLDVINRFYKNIHEDKLELSIKELIKEWVNDGNPIPILPKIVQNQLGFN